MFQVDDFDDNLHKFFWLVHTRLHY